MPRRSPLDAHAAHGSDAEDATARHASRQAMLEAYASGRVLAAQGETGITSHRGTDSGRVKNDPPSQDPPRRAPRTEGPRTTLRLPDALATTADQLAHELRISRNDAVLRLATRGARLYEQERHIADRREARWAAVIAGQTPTPDTQFPPADEARAAVLSAREQHDSETG